MSGSTVRGGWEARHGWRVAPCKGRPLALGETLGLLIEDSDLAALPIGSDLALQLSKVVAAIFVNHFEQTVGRGRAHEWLCWDRKRNDVSDSNTNPGQYETHADKKTCEVSDLHSRVVVAALLGVARLLEHVDREFDGRGQNILEASAELRDRLDRVRSTFCPGERRHCDDQSRDCDGEDSLDHEFGFSRSRWALAAVTVFIGPREDILNAKNPRCDQDLGEFVGDRTADSTFLLPPGPR